MSYALYFVKISNICVFRCFPALTVPPTLTTGGVFGVTRNPIYVAFLLPLLSFAYHSIPAALIASIAYIASMTHFIIRDEEAILRKTFGEAYDQYAANTPQWLFF